MISVEEAIQLVISNKKDFGTEEVDLLRSTGRILAEPVIADRDFPAYNRVTMDGIAINSNTFNKGAHSFTIEKIQPAGAAQKVLENEENCIEVMTGAILPANTDAVIPYEQCEIKDGTAEIAIDQLIPMQNVHLKSTDSKAGNELLKKGEKISAAMVGIMASVGLARVKVLRLPKVIICSTGDELVDINRKPEVYQIRRSNIYALASALLSEGIYADMLHLPDDEAEMTEEISTLIETFDAILFSGAVSKGKFDFLPNVLQKLGMNQVFHEVAQKPGKPFLFGTFSNSTVIFGFPGNPVSTFVCYHKFFKPWLYACWQIERSRTFAKLGRHISFKPALAYHCLVKLRNENGLFLANAIEGSGSGDLVTLTTADGIITLQADKDHFKEGEVFEVNVLS